MKDTRARSRRVLADAALVLAAVPVLLVGGASAAFADPASLHFSELADVIRRLTRLGQMLAVSVSSFFVVVAGLRWIMAGGDPGEIDKAKNALKGAAIGYLVAMVGEVILIALDYVTEYESL
ncbi:pilin [Nocardiopsis oceani]